MVALPDELSFLDGAMVACGLDTAYAACLRANVSGRDRVLITGLGPLGLGAALLCRAMGAQVVGVEAIPSRVGFAQELGFEEVVSPGDGALESLMNLTASRSASIVLALLPRVICCLKRRAIGAASCSWAKAAL